MTKRTTLVTRLSAIVLTLASTAFADIKLNEKFTVSGYAVGLADYSDVEQSDTHSTMDLQATKFLLKADFSPVAGTISFYAGSDNDPIVLDAFATYDLGSGVSVTGGKYLSWLGYEAFDPVNMMTITYAWQSGAYALNGIPAYHTGVKIEKSTDTYAAGFSVSDSNRVGLFTDAVGVSGTGLKGDGDLDNGVGLESYLTLKSSAFTAFFGLSYDSFDDDVKTPGDLHQEIDSYSADVWLQYVTGPVTLAGEFCYYVEDADAEIVAAPSTSLSTDYDSMFWGVWAKYAATEKLAYVGRVAGGSEDYADTAGLPPAADPTYMKFSFCPIYTVTGNLELVAEVSYTQFDDYGAAPATIDSATYVGVQGRFKF